MFDELTEQRLAESGIRLKNENGKHVVDWVSFRSNAFNAGIKTGDQILSATINGNNLLIGATRSGKKFNANLNLEKPKQVAVVSNVQLNAVAKAEHLRHVPTLGNFYQEFLGKDNVQGYDDPRMYEHFKNDPNDKSRPNYKVGSVKKSWDAVRARAANWCYQYYLNYWPQGMYASFAKGQIKYHLIVDSEGNILVVTLIRRVNEIIAIPEDYEKHCISFMNALSKSHVLKPPPETNQVCNHYIIEFH